MPDSNTPHDEKASLFAPQGLRSDKHDIGSAEETLSERLVAQGEYIAKMAEANDDTQSFAATIRETTESLRQQSALSSRTEQQLTALNNALLRYDPDPVTRIAHLTDLVADLLDADWVYYDRLENDMLCRLGEWNAPEETPAYRNVDGLTSVLLERTVDAVLSIHNLPDTEHVKTEPVLLEHSFQSFVGRHVQCEMQRIGCICAFFKRDYRPSVSDRKILGLASSPIASAALVTRCKMSCRICETSALISGRAFAISYSRTASGPDVF